MTNFNQWITAVGMRLLGRRNTWRLARSLYLKARADSPNNARLNGEEQVQRQLLATLRTTQEKWVVFDVGANVGTWTAYLLKEANGLSDRLVVHAFEPMPSTFAELQKRIRALPLGRGVHVSPVALSSESGPAELFVSGKHSLTNSLHPNAMQHNQTRIEIQKSTLSDYCDQFQIATIHFLKCDTEGHDMEVLLGGKTLFDQQRVIVCQFEYNHRWIYSRHYLKDVFDRFQGTPYRIGKITPVGVEMFSHWHPELERFFEGNYLLLHEKALSWFTTISGRFDAHNTYGVR